MTSIFKCDSYWLIVSAWRSPPDQAPKRLDFWSVFFAILGLFGDISCSFFNHWKQFGSGKGPFLMSKSGLGHQRCPKRRHPKISSRFGTDLEVNVWICFDFMGYAIMQRILLSSWAPGWTFSWIWVISSNVLLKLILHIFQRFVWKICNWSQFKHHVEQLFGKHAVETHPNSILNSNCCFLFEKCEREAASLGASGHVDNQFLWCKWVPFFRSHFRNCFFLTHDAKWSPEAHHISRNILSKRNLKRGRQNMRKLCSEVVELMPLGMWKNEFSRKDCEKCQKP